MKWSEGCATIDELQVIWAGLTMATAGAQHPRDIMAIRFFQAIFEASTFVGTHYILGSWCVH